MKKINLVELIALTLAAVASSPKDEMEKEQQDWADATMSSLPQAIFEALYEKKLLDQNGRPTPAGMKLVLNGCSFTPNFKALAEGDFGTALKMFFTGHAALVPKVAESETGEIMPKRDESGNWVNTEMCDNLVGVSNWILQVTETYRGASAPLKKTKK